MTFGHDVDALRVLFSDQSIAESDEVAPGLIVDYAEDGVVVGVEVLNASTVVSDRHFTIDRGRRL